MLCWGSYGSEHKPHYSTLLLSRATHPCGQNIFGDLFDSVIAFSTTRQVKAILPETFFIDKKKKVVWSYACTHFEIMVKY